MNWKHSVSPRVYRLGTIAIWLVALGVMIPAIGLFELMIRRSAWFGINSRLVGSVMHLVLVAAMIVAAFRLHYWLYVGRLNRLGIKVDAGTLSDFCSGFLRRVRGRQTDAELIARVHARGEFTQAELDSAAAHWDRDNWLADGAAETEKRHP
jgi:hypothetical protein